MASARWRGYSIHPVGLFCRFDRAPVCAPYFGLLYPAADAMGPLSGWGRGP